MSIFGTLMDRIRGKAARAAAAVAVREDVQGLVAEARLAFDLSLTA